jgi:hypothetical protein
MKAKFFLTPSLKQCLRKLCFGTSCQVYVLTKQLISHRYAIKLTNQFTNKLTCTCESMLSAGFPFSSTPFVIFPNILLYAILLQLLKICSALMYTI